MKMMKSLIISCLIIATSGSTAVAQNDTSETPTACKMFLHGKVVDEISLADAISWCELTPPTVQCNDGKVYPLHSFQVSFFTLKPLMNRDFGLGEGGIPIMAMRAIREGKSGDAIVLKEVTYLDTNGNVASLPIMSFKIK